MIPIITLRPHHTLCISFFEGKGYSPEFVANMTEVISSLKEHTLVRLTNTSDQICISCPNAKDDLCSHNQKVRRYDEAVLSVCQLEYGQVLEWQELHNKVHNLIIQSGMLRDICGDCQWNDICQRKTDRRMMNYDNKR